MPLYDYRCRSCEERFEALVRSGGAPVCPACGASDLEQQISTFAVSSAATRQSSLTAARRRNAKTARDKAVAQAEAERPHDHDH